MASVRAPAPPTLSLSSAPLSRKWTLISPMVPPSSDIPDQLLALMYLAVIHFPLHETDRLGQTTGHVLGPKGVQVVWEWVVCPNERL